MIPGWYLIDSSIFSFGTEGDNLVELDLCTDDTPPKFFKIVPDGDKLKIIVNDIDKKSEVERR